MSINFTLQIDASSLISASVMAAPCALAISKLSYPETEESPFKAEKNIKVACGYVYSVFFSTLNYGRIFLTKYIPSSFSRDEQNILEAASSGASASIGLVANIAANLIAFLAILAFINQALSWLGGMVGYPEITFQVMSEKKKSDVLIQKRFTKFELSHHILRDVCQNSSNFICSCFHS